MPHTSDHNSIHILVLWACVSIDLQYIERVVKVSVIWGKFFCLFVCLLLFFSVLFAFFVVAIWKVIFCVMWS